jgi:WD40 repeat protein
VDLLPSTGDAHVTTLVDGDATREHILNAIADISRRARPQDAIIIFYAGHGVAVDDRYYLLPEDLAFDGTPSELHARGLDTLPSSAISDLDLQNALAGEQAEVAALILDACQSGEVIGDKLAQRRGPMNSRGLAQMAYDKRMFILAASLSTQTAAEQDALEHGVLTFALVEEGLVQDMASPQRTPSGYSITTLTDWLRWGANRVAQSAGVSGDIRGFVFSKRQASETLAPLQQPRLLAPPESNADVTVALQAITLDPQTLTRAGYTQAVSPPALASTSLRPSRGQDLLFQPSTLGRMMPGKVLDGGHQMLASIENRIVALDLEHGAVLWRQPFEGTVVSFDVSPAGVMAVLDQSGNVSVVSRSEAPSAKIVVKGFGFYANGLVRWLKDQNEVLVVAGKTIAIYSAEGKAIKSVDLTAFSVYAPVLSTAGNWLYLCDSTGKVFSYQVPSLTPGPALEGIAPAQPITPGSFKFVTSLAVDAASRHLIRIMNDGSFTQALLPSMALDSKLLIHLERIRAASFSPDGNTLFVADTAGVVHAIRTSDGQVMASWPVPIDAIEAINEDLQGNVLVVSGNGGLMARSLPDGKLRFAIPGGTYFTTVTTVLPGEMNVMVAGEHSVRTFRLPKAEVTSTTSSTPGLFMSHNWIVGKTESSAVLWDGLNVKQSRRLDLTGDGRVDITPDGHYIVWAPAQLSGGSLQVLDASTGHSVRTVSISEPISAFAISADGRLLVYTARDQMHQVLVQSGESADAMIPQAPCCVVALTAANDRLFLASNLGNAMLYDLNSKRILRSIQVTYAIEAAEFVPSTGDVILATSDGNVYLWTPSKTEEPRLLGGVEGHVDGIAFNKSGTTLFISTNLGEVGWFSLASDGGQIATSTWLEPALSWLTQANDGRFVVSSDQSTPVGVLEAQHAVWRPVVQQPGFTPDLVEQLLSQ